MKRVLLGAVITLLTFFAAATFAHPIHHTKHNMILLGESEIFASHIVYKVPHNYQVILRVQFPEEVMRTYLSERKSFPQDQLIFLLDEMDIKDINSLSSISGSLLREDQTGKRTVFAEGVVLKKERFKVLFFHELPESLARTSH